ncbi:D-aminoacyl-tRNA deacylase [Bacillus cytotoxicus]
MRVVLQRSKEASVTVDGEIVGQIPFGLTLLVGITHEDTEQDATYIAEKNCELTYF